MLAADLRRESHENRPGNGGDVCLSATDRLSIALSLSHSHYYHAPGEGLEYGNC